MLRLERPQRVVEVGSGYSSALMLDVAERFLPHAPVFTFIDPYAERLRGLLHRGDQSKVEVLEQPAQAAPRELFESLNPGDVLFVDSSHVAKMASDVNYLVFEVLPALRPGVLCHFHDVLYPFEYPADWALRWKGFAWNEAYLLRAFLSFNREFEIVAFNSYLEQCHRERLAAAAPVALLSRGQSLWLRRRLA
jgi:predicted O-methyltransferase YrrM